jgi:cytochrome c-type biogenesis protein CcsB
MNLSFINLSLAAYFLAGILYFIYLIFTPSERKPQSERGISNFLRGQRKKTGGLIASVLFSAGFLFLTVAIIKRWCQAGRPPFSNLYESLIFFAWSVAFVYLIFEFIYKLRFLGVLVSLLIIFTLGFSSILDNSIQPLIPALQSNWLTIHVVSYFLGYGVVTISFILSIIYLGGSRKSHLDSSSLGRLDTLSYRLIALGFPFLTIGLTTGAVWANVAWGTYWGWDPKETWSLITWIIYALYLHLRLMKGWRGRKTAYLNIIAFLTVLFTFLGVNYLLAGLHSYL